MTSQELNSTFDKFFSENNGKPIVVLPSSIADNNHGQCFDLATEWTNRLGVPHFPNNPSPFPFKNAEQIYTDYGQFQAQYFDRIKNTPDFIPQKGDIVLWPAALNGGAGHVAVATGEGTTSWFKSFDQNWNPKDWYPRIIQHDYGVGAKEVLGVLRLKVTQDNMGDNIKRKSYFTDIMVQGVTEFWGGNVNTDNITEAKWREYIAWVKDNVYRAGQYDLTKKEAGVTGNVPYGPVVAALRKQGSFNIEDFKKKVISFVQSL